MSAMQTFYNWLTTPGKTADARKSRLAQLTRASRAKIMQVASEVVWYVWTAPQA